MISTSGTSCVHCGTQENLGFPMLNGFRACPKCAMFLDTTYCGVCGIIGLADDMSFTKDRRGPFCPPCCDVEDADEDDWDDDYGDDFWDEPDDEEKVD